MSVDYDDTPLAIEADERIRTFQADAAKRAGIFHHLITLPTYHTAALSTDNLAKEYFGEQGMLGYVKNVQRAGDPPGHRLREAPEHVRLRHRRRPQGILRRRSGPEGRRRPQHHEPVRLTANNRRLTMTTGSNFWVIGGEFGSMNFHKLVEGSAQVQGPFKTRKEAEDCLARGLGREPPQGRRALLDRRRAEPGRGLNELVAGYRARGSVRGQAPNKCPRTDGPIRISGWGRLSFLCNLLYLNGLCATARLLIG